MAFQFVHVQTFSIKSGGAGIAAEAERKESHSRHVKNPKPPVLVAGVEPIQAWDFLVESHGKARDRYTKKSGVKAERKLRSDAHILIGAVASHPEPTATCDIESPDFKDWLDRSIAFFTTEHGEPLSVVMHLDESHPHIHFLAAPDLENGQRMPDVHAGEKAKEKVGGKHAKKHVKDQAWKEAMRSYQDRYHEAVGVYHGLARLGPKRRRLPAGAYQAEQAEAKRRAEQLKKIEQAAAEQSESLAELDANWRFTVEENKRLYELEDELEAQKTENEEVRAQINKDTAELKARERAVSVAQGEVGDLKRELAGREEKVSKAQAQVSEAQDEIDLREADVAAAKTEVQKENEKLNKRRNNLKKTKERLDSRIASVSQREQRLAGVSGAFVSAITLGRAGTKRRVEKAVEAVNASFKAELAETTKGVEKAAQAHERAVQRLHNKNRLLEEQNSTLASTVSAAEKAQRETQAKLQELDEKLGQLKAKNKELTTVRDSLSALVEDLEVAVNAGDIAEAQDLLNPGSAGPELRL